MALVQQLFDVLLLLVSTPYLGRCPHLLGMRRLTWCLHNGLLMWQKLTEAEVKSS